ncbi:MAG: hypothetical protein KC420_23400, partial [Myxococcales bacterium]|nr:hypothetical protein [Myxococcales bacterium]
MPAFVRRLHARFRAIPLRLRRALLLPFALALPLALAGCEPGTATDSATESDGATSSATSGSAGETTGETTGETAAVDCEEFSTAVPGLTWTATHDGARTELVALPGGHAVHLTDAHTVARTGPDGVVWSKTFDEWVSQLAPLPGDRIAVA